MLYRVCTLLDGLCPNRPDFLSTTDRTYLDIQFVNFVKEIFDTILTSAPVQKDEFDVSGGQKGRDMLIVYLCVRYAIPGQKVRAASMNMYESYSLIFNICALLKYTYPMRARTLSTTLRYICVINYCSWFISKSEWTLIVSHTVQRRNTHTHTHTHRPKTTNGIETHILCDPCCLFHQIKWWMNDEVGLSSHRIRIPRRPAFVNFCFIQGLVLAHNEE